MVKVPLWKAWDESCFNCAITRGWTKEYLLSMPYPFQCVHRQDMEGKQRVCAVWKKRVGDFQFQ